MEREDYHEFLTTHGTLLEKVFAPFEEVIPPFRRSFHMLRRMDWHLRRFYLIWGAYFGS
jgi:hypothetical protein